MSLIFIGSLIITWIIGLIPPILIRYVFLKRPADTRLALSVCALFVVANLAIFIGLGSTSKTHFAVYLIACASYAILRAGRTTPSEKNIGPAVGERKDSDEQPLEADLRLPSQPDATELTPLLAEPSLSRAEAKPVQEGAVTTVLGGVAQASGSYAMNMAQRLVLAIVAVLILGSFLYPPYHYLAPPGALLNLGYAPIFAPPRTRIGLATVDVLMLVVEWMGILILGGVAWLLLRNAPRVERNRVVASVTLPMKGFKTLLNPRFALIAVTIAGAITALSLDIDAIRQSLSRLFPVSEGYGLFDDIPTELGGSVTLRALDFDPFEKDFERISESGGNVTGQVNPPASPKRTYTEEQVFGAAPPPQASNSASSGHFRVVTEPEAPDFTAARFLEGNPNDGKKPLQLQAWLTARNTEFKFRFIYPPDWKINTPRGPNVRFSVSGPTDAGVNCNVVARRMPELARMTQRELNSELEKPFSPTDWKDAIGAKFPDVAVIENRLTKVDNRPVQFAVARLSYTTPSASISAQNVNIVTLSPGIFWHFACGVGASTATGASAEYVRWRPVFMQIISSFVFEN